MTVPAVVFLADLPLLVIVKHGCVGSAIQESDLDLFYLSTFHMTHVPDFTFPLIPDVHFPWNKTKL